MRNEESIHSGLNFNYSFYRMRFDLIIELIFLVIITIFQFLLGIALTSGTNDTCKAIKDSNTTNR